MRDLLPSGRERGGHGGWIGGLKEASELLGLGGSTEICMGILVCGDGEDHVFVPRLRINIA